MFLDASDVKLVNTLIVNTLKQYNLFPVHTHFVPVLRSPLPFTKYNSTKNTKHFSVVVITL